jgi:anti-sigma factor RsiW
MTCRELSDSLMAYLSAELCDAEAERCERHLRRCADCAAYRHSYEQTVRLGRTACRHRADHPAAHLPEDLVQAILAAQAQRV